VIHPKSIRIESRLNEKGGHYVSVTDAENGEFVPNITGIVIKLVPNDLVIADITYAPSRHGEETVRQCYVQGFAFIADEVKRVIVG
jgi:hypothetical protein